MNQCKDNTLFLSRRFVVCARSEHQFVRRLVESDLRRVATAGEQVAAFRAVSFREYERRPGKK